jgi:hypothetical protein
VPLNRPDIDGRALFATVKLPAALIAASSDGPGTVLMLRLPALFQVLPPKSHVIVDTCALLGFAVRLSQLKFHGARSSAGRSNCEALWSADFPEGTVGV